MPVLPDSLTLHDSGVVLRDWRQDDAPALEPVCGDPDVCQFSTVPWTYTPSAAAAWIRRIHDHRSSGTALGLAITREHEDRALGHVNLVRFSDGGRAAALGYWLLPAARRQGPGGTAAGGRCARGVPGVAPTRRGRASPPCHPPSQAAAGTARGGGGRGGGA